MQGEQYTTQRLVELLISPATVVMILFIAGGIVFVEFPQTFPWKMLIHAAGAAYIAAKAYNLHTHWKPAAAASGIAGGISTMVIGAYVAFQLPTLGNIFAIFTQPVFVGILDAIAAGAIYELYSASSQLYKHYSPPKEEPYE